MTDPNKVFMQRAIDLARQSMQSNTGGPFGCVIVKDGVIVGEGSNCVTTTNDPTGHAEVTAIRNACKNLNTFQLDGCDIYSSCEPCPMCLGAIYWARPSRLFFGCNKKDAAKIGFDDDFIYKEISLKLSERAIPTLEIMNETAVTVFEEWDAKTDKIKY